MHFECCGTLRSGPKQGATNSCCVTTPLTVPASTITNNKIRKHSATIPTQLRKGDGSALASAYVQLIHTPRGKMKPHLHEKL